MAHGHENSSWPGLVYRGFSAVLAEYLLARLTGTTQPERLTNR